MSSNVFPIYDQLLATAFKEDFLKQKGVVFWLTGLSGSGKSTIAKELEKAWFENGRFVQVLDGDNIRSGLNNNLTFSATDRTENIRRIAEVAKLFMRSGIVTVCSFISPLRDQREMARNIIGVDRFLEVHVDASLALCEERDVKGLYKKARSGEIKDFTGISAPYENPQNPNIRINTGDLPVVSSANLIMAYYDQWVIELEKTVA